MFRRAIMESGGNVFGKNRPIKTPEEALKDAKDLAKQLDCSDDQKWLECLRKVDAKKFISDRVPFPLDNTDFLPHSAQKIFKGSNYSRGRYLCSTPAHH